MILTRIESSKIIGFFLCSIIWCIVQQQQPSCFVMGFSLPMQLREQTSSSSSALSVAAAPPPMERERNQQSIERTSKIPAVKELKSKQEFLSFIDDSKTNDLQVIKYYASYCKTCQKVKPLYQRIANDEENININNRIMHFGSIEVSTIGDKATLESLGISKLPFIQIYRNSKCVASFSTGAQTYNFSKKVKDTIKSCKERTVEGWNTFLTLYEKEIQEQRNAVDTLFAVAREEQQQQ